MYFVCVRVEVLPAQVDAFVDLVRFNAAHSRKEPACVRFDVLRSHDNPHLFRLHEIYKDEAGFKAHQATAHYARWKDEIAGLCATPRTSERLAGFDLTP